MRTMMKFSVLGIGTVLLTVLWLSLASEFAFAGKGGKGGGGESGIELCMTFRDDSGDAIGSDVVRSGDNSYCHNKQAKIKVALGSFLNLEVNSASQSCRSGRALFVDFFDRCATSCSDPSLPSAGCGETPDGPSGYPDHGHFNIRSDAGGNDIDISDWRALAVGGTMLARLRVQFEIDGTTWFLVFGAQEVAECVGGSPVTITRLTGTDRWCIESKTGDVACLFRVASPGNYEPHGQYYMPFAAIIEPAP